MTAQPNQGVPPASINPLRDVVIVGGSISATSAATATAVPPTYAEGSIQPLSQDLNGQLRISGTISASSSAKATTAAPSYVNNTDNAFSQNLTGDLRTIAKQSGTWTVAVDQTTPGATNAVDVTNFPVTVDTNSGNKSSNTIRVTLATDQVQLTNALKVDGSGVTQPVSASSLPLPTGAATETTLSAVNTKLGGTLAVSGTFWQATQPVSGTFWQATQPVSIASALTANPTNTTPVLKNGLSTTVFSVIASQAAVLDDYYIYNPNTSVAYVQIFDIATSGGVTLGTSVPKWSIGIPPSSAANLSRAGLSFALGIQVAATTTPTGSSAPSTALDTNFGYR